MPLSSPLPIIVRESHFPRCLICLSNLCRYGGVVCRITAPISEQQVHQREQSKPDDGSRAYLAMRSSMILITRASSSPPRFALEAS